MDKDIKEKDYLEIDPLQLIKALVKRIWIVILAVIVCGGAMFWYTSYMVPKQYTAKALLCANNSSIQLGSTSFSISSADLTAAKSLVDSYIILMKSRNVLSEVIDIISEQGLDYDYNTLKGMISAESVEATEFFEVKVTSTNPENAAIIANTIIKVLPEKIQEKMEGSSVQVVDEAIVPTKKSAPNVTRQTAFGMVIGFLISAAGILIAEMMDQYIRSEEYLLQTFSDIPVLSIIPDLDESHSKRQSGKYYGSKKGE